MISDEDYNAQGTFYFPAGFRNETQYVAFWDTVAVPDSALRRLLSQQVPLERALARGALETYRETARKIRKLGEIEVDVSDWVRELMARNATQVQARLPEIEAKILELEEKLAKRRPAEPDELLTQVLTRPVARATGLAAHFPADLDVATRERILDHEFELGVGRWMSARDIVDRFKTLELDFLHPGRS